MLKRTLASASDTLVSSVVIYERMLSSGNRDCSMHLDSPEAVLGTLAWLMKELIVARWFDVGQF